MCKREQVKQLEAGFECYKKQKRIKATDRMAGSGSGGSGDVDGS